jgi:DNA repair exonuclease SbcCD ATPase subunit
MGRRIDLFCENLRQRLTIVESGLQGLKTKIDDNAAQAERDVQNHLDRVRKRIEQRRAKVAEAKVDVSRWIADRDAITAAVVADWQSKRDVAKLQGRADRAERCAVAAIEVAAAAIDEAEQASLEAWLARVDSDYTPQAAQT